MIEHEFSHESFIGGWYIPNTICDELIKEFKKARENDLTVQGEQRLGGKLYVDKEVKESEDLAIGPLYTKNPIGDYRYYLQKCLNNYVKKYEWANLIDPYNINEIYNIQYYKPGGGYKVWHSERTNKASLKRILVFMTYLNNVDDGGTEFLYQKLTCPAKKGLTIIWPAEWTHTHKGQISLTKEKYIVTGWYSFNEH